MHLKVYKIVICTLMMTCDDDQLIIGKKMNNQCSVRMLYEYFVVNETGIEKSKLDE